MGVRPGGREQRWPLTEFQATLSRLLATNRSEDSYAADAAPLLAAPNSHRFSHDLDYFHDSAERVATAFAADQGLLADGGYSIEPEISQPGYIRVVVRLGASSTKIEWAQDSTWRFMPVQRSEQFGYQLHPIDLARLDLAAPIGLAQIKAAWQDALHDAEVFVRSRPPAEAGCLYYSPDAQGFVSPGAAAGPEVVPHFGRPGGVLPRLLRD